MPKDEKSEIRALKFAGYFVMVGSLILLIIFLALLSQLGVF